MFDGRLRPLIDPPLAIAGTWLAGRGITANQMTWLGFAFGLAAMAALAVRFDGLAAVLLLLNRLCDGLDGAVARVRGPTDLGGFLDIVLDFLVYSGLVLAFALGRPEHALAAAVLIFSFVGSGTSFLAFSIFAEKRKLSSDAQGRKSMVYVAGLAEGGETILVLLLICCLPALFPYIAYGFAALCGLTTVGRIAEGIRRFGTSGPDPRSRSPDP